MAAGEKGTRCEAKPVGKVVNDRVGAFTIVHVAETHEQAIANHGAEAAINYLLYAFRVLGGFVDPQRGVVLLRPDGLVGLLRASLRRPRWLGGRA